MLRAFLPCLLLALLLQSAVAQSTVFLVRHAEKAEASGGNEKDPELSETGRARATSLAGMLRDVRITHVFATEYKRTQQTARAVAERTDSEVTIVPAKETAQLIAKLKEITGNVLVVGHSNTLPEILAALGAAERLQIDETEYDNLFLWTPATKQLLRLRYPTACCLIIG
ncbi:MAG: histidine phosphatase family protein, partial [Chthoniobacterales bacterium]|nr:histidine phosphatase family protein [Chthoniobacterales bacterium]